MLSFILLRLKFIYHDFVQQLKGREDSQVPVPPAKLRHRVHGSIDIKGYLAVGKESWKNISDILKKNGLIVTQFKSVLDFGCGPGRVVQNICTSDHEKIIGVDIDIEAINWCSRKLGDCEFKHIGPLPPLAIEDESCDLVYAISVFTHLNEEMQDLWLEEMSRILTPEGVMLASIHGNRHREIRKLKVDGAPGFVFTQGSRGRFKKDGLPDFYQDAQHTRDYVMQHWSRYFSILDYVEAGIGNHQDAVLMAKRPCSEQPSKSQRLGNGAGV